MTYVCIILSGWIHLKQLCCNSTLLLLRISHEYSTHLLVFL